MVGSCTEGSFGDPERKSIFGYWPLLFQPVTGAITGMGANDLGNFRFSVKNDLLMPEVPGEVFWAVSMSKCASYGYY